MVRREEYVGLLNSANISSLFSPSRSHFRSLFQVQTSDPPHLPLCLFMPVFLFLICPCSWLQCVFFFFTVIFTPLSLLFSLFFHLFIYLGTTTLFPAGEVGVNLQAAHLFLRPPSTFPVPGRPFILGSLVSRRRPPRGNTPPRRTTARPRGGTTSGNAS